MRLTVSWLSAELHHLCDGVYLDVRREALQFGLLGRLHVDQMLYPGHFLEVLLRKEVNWVGLKIYEMSLMI